MTKTENALPFRDRSGPTCWPSAALTAASHRWLWASKRETLFGILRRFLQIQCFNVPMFQWIWGNLHQNSCVLLLLCFRFAFNTECLRNAWTALWVALAMQVCVWAVADRVTNSELKIPWKHIKFLDSLLDIDFYTLTIIFFLRFFPWHYNIFHFSPWQNDQFLYCQGETLTVGQPSCRRHDDNVILAVPFRHFWDTLYFSVFMNFSINTVM